MVLASFHQLHHSFGSCSMETTSYNKFGERWFGELLSFQRKVNVDLLTRSIKSGASQPEPQERFSVNSISRKAKQLSLIKIDTESNIDAKSAKKACNILLRM